MRRDTENKQSPILLTPGPLNTSAATKQAMLRDWGSRDDEFIALTAGIRRRLVEIVHGEPDYLAVPIQGSGTFALEAALGTLLGPRDKLLVLSNGAYGGRLGRIAAILGRAHAMLDHAEAAPLDPAWLEKALASDAAITHVAAVHCETSSGMLNPIGEIAKVCARHNRRLLVDAMSSLGAVPIDAGAWAADAIVSSANKCLEGVPGLAFALVRRGALEAAKGQSPSLSLDLYGQWQGFEANGQWRFTPPTHAVAALHQALSEFAAEGGVAGRGKRYGENHRVLVAGMRGLGFETFLPDECQAPTIVAFRQPKGFDFPRFYDAMRARGFVVYPGSLTEQPTFRIGCMGRIDADDIRAALAAVAESLKAIG